MADRRPAIAPPPGRGYIQAFALVDKGPRVCAMPVGTVVFDCHRPSLVLDADVRRPRRAGDERLVLDGDVLPTVSERLLQSPQPPPAATVDGVDRSGQTGAEGTSALGHVWSVVSGYRGLFPCRWRHGLDPPGRGIRRSRGRLRRSPRESIPRKLRQRAWRTRRWVRGRAGSTSNSVNCLLIRHIGAPRGSA